MYLDDFTNNAKSQGSQFSLKFKRIWTSEISHQEADLSILNGKQIIAFDTADQNGSRKNHVFSMHTLML